MSFATYDALVATIASWLSRDDLTTQIPDFIRLAEARMQRELKPFSTRVADFGFLLSATTGRAGPIPGQAGVVQIERVGFRVVDAALTFNPARPLVHVSERELLASHDLEPMTGEPLLYAVIGQEIAVYPFPNVPKDSLGVDSSYSILVSMVGPTLSFGVPVTSINFSANPIVSQHPDLYLYGALAEAAPFLQHDERLPVWEARFTRTVKAVNVQYSRLLFGPELPRRPLPMVFT